MTKSFEKIGMVDEEELMELSGATEVEPRTTWPCATFGGTIAITTYTMDRSYESCPTTACSTRC
ncbi:class II lanthipeptide, LchA2/BrtA2 family [Pontibacillus litoralis]|uniref:Lantibiotic n=1 Tax=Pontibacillus litoralis JSM 072002 TaxID=1385512 RepID=A0A0A5G1Q1_9BACI|nr:class II lanthipeptide, LchA2/BrtA2 family [Pontibacillus litoralis]KGX85053.1 hypothetical protein N784_11195 [Pontibacillus litoralis JSM 072002]